MLVKSQLLLWSHVVQPEEAASVAGGAGGVHRALRMAGEGCGCVCVFVCVCVCV